MKLREASNLCQRVFEAAKHTYANKIGVSHFPANCLS